MWQPERIGFTLSIGQVFSWDYLPLFIKICLIIALLAITGILLVISAITIRKMVIAKQDRRIKLLAAQVNDLLLPTVISDQTSRENTLFTSRFDTGSFFGSGLSVKKIREVIVKEMLNYRSYFSGEIALRIQKLYVGLSLHKQALKRLTVRNWETQTNALAELFKMDIEVPRDQLVELARHENRYITELARLSLIKFSKGNPLQFLEELPNPISPWEELEIFHLLQQWDDIPVESVRKFISVDKDPTHASLALKLAVHFRLIQTIPDMVSLTQTPDLKLRAQVIMAIGKLGAVTAEKHLHAVYHDQTIEIRLAILRAMGQIRSGQYLTFLENEFLHAEDFRIKLAASAALIHQHPLSDTTINNLLKNHEPLNKLILRHSMDPLINAI